MFNYGIDPTKTYSGIILPYHDKLNPNKYAVHIPELHSSFDSKMGEQYSWVENQLNDQFYSIKKLDGTYEDFGSYFPLTSELNVYVRFRDPSDHSGIIVGVHEENKSIPNNISRNDYYLVAGTKNGSKIYIDDTKDRVVLQSTEGKSNIVMDSSGIVMQMNDTRTEKTTFLSKMELSENGFTIQFGENKLTFNETGFGITYGENRTFFKMTKKGIEIIGEEFLNLTTNGPLNIYGETTNLTGEGSLNLRGTNTKLTGLQKLAMNGNIIHMEGVMDTHIKSGLSLNIESLLHLRTTAIISDQQYTGMSNIFASMENKTTSLSAENSTMKAEAITTTATDGMILKNMGVGSSTGASVSTASVSTMAGLQASMMAVTTTFNLDNIAMSIASAVMSDNMIADTAEPASNVSDNLFGTLTTDEDGTNFITKMIDIDKAIDSGVKKYESPSTLLTNYNDFNKI
jgi:hypothetical protein